VWTAATAQTPRKTVMRENHPVIDREYPLADGRSLVSTTDLKGRILYCNPSFISVSGFTKEELLGQPHNMIRHPDMPAEAFRDMWETIGSGRPWSALVKNRRKDGTYYWVRANVTPLMGSHGPTGYLSVRTVPTRADVQACDALYATMRAEAAAGVLVHRLHHGEVVTSTFADRFARLLRPGLGQRMAWANGAVLIAVGAAAGASWPALLGGSAVGAAALSWFMLRQTQRPLSGLLDFANRMAAGDLTQTVPAEHGGMVGELARALRQLNVNLRALTRDMRDEIVNMHGATTEIARGNSDLSSRTESQAASLQQTAASMDEITGTVRSSADSAQQAVALTTEANGATRAGGEAVERMSLTMHGISEASQKIRDIIGVIESIAFQTNILALNAAVEAARAGDHGRGFAVVAAEVRSLAQRTGGAAKEVRQLIADAADKVDRGAEQTRDALDTMQRAQATVEHVTQMVREISMATKEQLQGISQVNEAVTQMDTITQQNAALVEQTAAAAEALTLQADEVASSMKLFHLESDSGKTDDAVALRRAARAAVGERERSAA
jgi:aerotaxis receptor